MIRNNVQQTSKIDKGGLKYDEPTFSSGVPYERREFIISAESASGTQGRRGIQVKVTLMKIYLIEVDKKVRG